MSAMLAERSTLIKERRGLQAELAQLHAEKLVAQLHAQGELCTLAPAMRLGSQSTSLQRSGTIFARQRMPRSAWHAQEGAHVPVTVCEDSQCSYDHR